MMLYASPSPTLTPVISSSSLAGFRPYLNFSPIKTVINHQQHQLSCPSFSTHQISIRTKSTSNSSEFDVPPPANDVETNDDDLEVEVEKIGKNSRRLRCEIGIDANLMTVWKLLTDYERLSDYIPGLALSQLLEQRDNYAKVFQIGQQNLAFGLKFNAKGIMDCYEKDLETTSFGQRRDIEFNMVEGDFQIFQGKWSIEEKYNESNGGIQSIEQECQTTLSYVVDVKPKLWLPIRLVEGILCKELKLNLLCIREEAQKVFYDELRTC